MNPGSEKELHLAHRNLQAAQAELEELRQQIQDFEALVDARLGSLLDQLSAIRSEIASLNEDLHQIREDRMFGQERIRIQAGAPVPLRPSRWEEPSVGEMYNAHEIPITKEKGSASPGAQLPDIKRLYRVLARRYHPDLAGNESDRRELNERMAEINQYYRDVDLGKLMDMAGMTVPFYLKLKSATQVEQASKPQSELERIQLELKDVQSQISRLSRMPSVKLSLDVKLAWRQGHDLLAEMKEDLQYRVERKLAERDYLRAQVRASSNSVMD